MFGCSKLESIIPMSRTLSYAMPKKRQLGGMIGATPQTSTPIGSVANPTKLQVGGDTQGTPMLKNPFARPVFASDPNSPFPPSQEQQKGNAYYQALNKQYAQSGDQANALRAKQQYAPLTQQEGAQAKANNYQRMMDMAAQEGQLQGIKAGAAEKAAKMASGGGGNPYGKLEHGGYAQGPPTHMDLGGTVTTGGFSQFNKPKMVGTSVQHMEKGGYIHGPQPPHALAYGGKNIASPIHAERGAGSRESLLPAPEDIGGGKAEGWIGGGNQGRLRKVITGGYGAQPARAGRIGYRGTLQARPESGGSPSGLAGFYAKQNALGQKNAARQGIDPVTRMSYSPTDKEVMDQLDMVGRKYGPAERAMLSDYYEGGRTGDFAKRAAAEASIKKRRDEIAGKQPQIPDALKRREPQVPDYFGNAMNAAKNMTTSSPMVVAPTNTGGQNPGGLPVKEAMGKLEEFAGPAPQNYADNKASGGNASPVKPYIVNEKGEEAWQPDGEKPQLMPGKEKMVLFPKDGKVIPHGRTMEMARKGQVEMPEHAENGVKNRGSEFPRPQKNISSFGKDGKEPGYKPKAQPVQPRKNLSKLEPLSEKESGLLADLISRARHTPEWVSRLNPGQWIQGPKSEIPERVRQELGLPATYEGQGIGGEVANRIAAENEAIRGALDSGKFENISHTLASGRRIPQIAMVQKPQIPGLEEATAPMARAMPVPPTPAPATPQSEPALNEEDLAREGQFWEEPGLPLPTTESAAWKASEQPKLLGETLTKAESTPEQIKAQTGYTPEEMELLAQGQEMTARGISEMGPKGVKFASGGGIENGKAFGPHVIPEQKPVTIRPGKVKDELGDVGTRLAKQKEEKEFMERWESDENMGRTSQMAQKREDGGSVKSGTPMMNSPIPKPPIFNVGEANPFLQAVGQWNEGQPFPLPPNAPGVGGHYPLSAYGTFKNSPEAWAEAIQQQAAMEQYAKEAMANREARRGRTKSFAK